MNGRPPCSQYIFVHPELVEGQTRYFFSNLPDIPFLNPLSINKSGCEPWPVYQWGVRLSRLLSLLCIKTIAGSSVRSWKGAPGLRFRYPLVTLLAQGDTECQYFYL
jgi:hypothetical protein